MDYFFSTGMAPLSGTATREIFKYLSRPEIVSFAGGLPASDCLPSAQIQEICAEIFADPAQATRCLQYGTTEGYPELKEQIRALVENEGIHGAGLDTILIASGGSQALDLAVKCLINPGDVVLVEDPTFLGFLATVQSYSARPVGVKADDSGLVLEDLEEKIKKYKAKLLYTVPNFSNPTGKTYTLENRKAIVSLALKYNMVVVEDDPYGRLRFAGEKIPPIKSFDDRGIVLYVSSFSKTISPGLRLGYAHGHPDLIRKMTIAKQGNDLHTSNLVQLIVKTYLEKGYFYSNIEKSLPIYRERETAMIDAIRQYMPREFKHTNPDGGLFIWGEFNAPLNTAQIFREAIDRNVAYIDGSSFYGEGESPEGPRGLNTLRLNYTNETLDRIKTGIQSLGELFSEKIAAL